MEHRKKFLIICVSSTIFIGFLFVASIFSKSLLPNAKSSGIMEINLTKVPLGEAKVFKPEYFNPIMVYRPDDEAKHYLVSLNEITNGLDFTIENIPDFFIYHPFSTHLGCPLQKVKKNERLSYGYTGLIDPCHRGFWDYAGRLIPTAHGGKDLKNLKKFTNYKEISKNVLLLSD